MYTVKIDKKGKILVPVAIRKRLKLFSGQQMSVNISNDCFGKDIIIIKPFEYKCRWCGAEIPEGKEFGSCEKCSKENIRQIY